MPAHVPRGIMANCDETAPLCYRISCAENPKCFAIKQKIIELRIDVEVIFSFKEKNVGIV
jgi:hypothetical protein